MFEEILESLTVSDLKPRLALINTADKPTRKADIAAAIRRHMLSPRCRDCWQELDELEQNAVAEAVHRWSGRYRGLEFFAKYGSIPQFFKGRPRGYVRNREKPKRTLLGLFFFGGVIPDELCALLKEFVPAPASGTVRTVGEEEIPETLSIDASYRGANIKPFAVKTRSMEPIARHDLSAMLRMVESGQILVSDKTGLASTTTLGKIEGTLLEGDYYSSDEEWSLKAWEGSAIRPIRAFAWPLLLQSGGLAKTTGKKLQLTPKGRKAIRRPFEDTLRDLYARWRDKGAWDEFRRIDVVKGQTGKGRRMTPPAERRRTIEAGLLECPVGEWFELDELYRYLLAESHHFDVAHDPWKLYVVDINYGNMGYASSSLLNTRYLLVYLFEYLASLGLIDVAYVPPYYARGDYRGLWGVDDLVSFSRYDGLLYVRLNALGAYCLGRTAEYLPNPVKVTPLLRVDDELNITLVRNPDPGERLLLEQYAVVLSETVWRLSQQSMLQAIEKGQDPSIFHGFLRQSAMQDLPDEVSRFFEAIASRESAISDAGPARLLHCDSAALAKMLAEDPATKPHCLHAGGRVIAVPQRAQRAFRNGLRKLGYVLPEVLAK